MKSALCNTMYEIDAELCNEIFIEERDILTLLYGVNECVEQ